MLLGAGTFPIAGWMEDTLARLGGATPSPASIATLAGLIEESGKFAAALARGVVFHGLRGPSARAAVVYGSLAGLGMAALEAATYHHQWLAEGWSFLPHQIPRLYAHMILGGLAAWGARRGGRLSVTRALRAMVALATAAALHAALDWTSLAPDLLRQVPGAPNSVQVALVLVATGLYGFLLSRGAGREAAGVRQSHPRSAVPGHRFPDAPRLTSCPRDGPP
jgi:RsiW-degrading membrane proteinase PrsW (M82 family)